MRTGTLARRVMIASGVLLVAVSTCGVLLVTTATGLRSTQVRQSDVFTAARQSTTDLLGAYVDQETGLRGYVITGQPAFLAPYTDAQPRIPAIVSRLHTVTATVPGALTQLVAVQDAYRDWAGYATEQVARVAAGDPAAAATVAATGAGKTRFDALRSRVADLQAVLQAGQHANEATVMTLQQRLVGLLIASLILLTALI